MSEPREDIDNHISEQFRISTLSVNEFRSRFQNCQNNIQKGILAIAALGAFWFAIEKNFSNYVELEKLREQKIGAATSFREAINRLPRQLNSAIRESLSKIKQPDEENPTRFSDQVELVLHALDNREAIREQLASDKKNKNDTEERFNIARKNTIDFSFLGISLPAQLWLAPLLWLGAAFALIFYIYRQRNLAIYNATLYIAHSNRSAPQAPVGSIPFSALGTGSSWLAPLPNKVSATIPRQDPFLVDSEVLSEALGWLDSSSKIYRNTNLMIASIFLFVELRILYIASVATNEFALKEEFINLFLHTVALGFGLGLVGGSFFIVYRWLSNNSPSIGPHGLSSDVSRRAFVAGFTGLLFGVLWRTKSSTPVAVTVATYLPLNANVARRLTGGYSPRFLSSEAKIHRKRNYNIARQAGHMSSFVTRDIASLRLRASINDDVALHYADARGFVRLFSTSNSVRRMSSLSDEQAISWSAPNASDVQTSDDIPTRRLTSRNGLAWELAAIDKLEKGEIGKACSLLVAGVRAAPDNLRLVELLAGLAIRYPKEGPTLDYIVQTWQPGADLPAATFEAKRDKWLTVASSWRRRWSDTSRPVWWHHPLETRDYAWKRTRKMPRPPENPEQRQRPIKIA